MGGTDKFISMMETVKNKLLKFYGVECYDSLDTIPAYNFMEIITKGELKLLLKGRIKLSQEIILLLQARWKRIYDQYINHFGFSDRFLKILELKRKIALLQIKKMQTGDDFIETFILIHKSKLEFLESKQDNGMDFYEIKTHLENHFKFRIDPKTTTAIEFYSYIQQLKAKK